MSNPIPMATVAMTTVPMATVTMATITADVDPRDRAKPRAFRLADGSVGTVRFTANGGALLRAGNRTVVLSPAEVRALG